MSWPERLVIESLGFAFVLVLLFSVFNDVSASTRGTVVIPGSRLKAGKSTHIFHAKGLGQKR